MTTGIAVLSAVSAEADSVRDIPGLESITFFERSGGTFPTGYEFLIDDPELLERLPSLSAASNDFSGVSTEFYDVFLSDSDGSLNEDGEFVTIEGVFEFGLPLGGGLNIAEMQLNFDDGSAELGNVVASFNLLGDNGTVASVTNAIDGDFLTNTRLGNTVGTDDRLRLTLGFESSSGPAVIPTPLSAAMGLAAMAVGAGMRRRGGLSRD